MYRLVLYRDYRSRTHKQVNTHKLHKTPRAHIFQFPITISTAYEPNNFEFYFPVRMFDLVISPTVICLPKMIRIIWV